MKKYRTLIIFFAIFLIAVFVAYALLKNNRILPVFSPADINTELVDESMQNVRKKHRIADFNLLNQDGENTTIQDLEGRIYVADFFFTTCQTICPKMQSNMQKVYQEFEGNQEIKFVSHTVLPEIDSVPVMKQYAENLDAKTDQWLFLTGEKKEIYDLARKSYCVVKFEDSLFVHTENLALIDEKLRVRGYYDGTKQAEVNQLIDDIYLLLHHKQKAN